MTDARISADSVRKVEDYLKGYTFNRRLVELDNYERKFFGAKESEWESECPGELPLARARMFEIRHFVMSMENCEEKLFLYYHYIKGESVERCAELLNISRSSAFRLKKKSLCLAARSFIPLAR